MVVPPQEQTEPRREDSSDSDDNIHKSNRQPRGNGIVRDCAHTEERTDHPAVDIKPHLVRDAEG